MNWASLRKEGTVFLSSLLFGVTLWPWIYLAAAGRFRGDEPMRGAGIVHRYLLENWMDLQAWLLVLVPYGLVMAGRQFVRAFSPLPGEEGGS